MKKPTLGEAKKRWPDPDEKEPRAHDFSTVGEYAEKLIKFLVRKELEKRDSQNLHIERI